MVLKTLLEVLIRFKQTKLKNIKYNMYIQIYLNKKTRIYLMFVDQMNGNWELLKVIN